MEYDIYTDGACSGNPGPGGWAAVIINKSNNKIEEISGPGGDTTNNKMELMAAIKGIEHLPPGTKINLYTDSKYVCDGITKWICKWKANNWRTSAKKAVKNDDLWQHLDELTTNYQIKWAWVNAHSGIEYNERADNLARCATVGALVSS